MATITEPQAMTTRSRRRARVKKHSLKTDMTPMVDLGFLLIAFFVMTTEMSRPSVTKLYMPKEGGEPSTLAGSNALTFLVGAEHSYYYLGDWEKAKAAGEIRATSFDVKTGIGRIIRERQAWLEASNSSKEGKNGLMFIIKPAPNANYKQVIDALDETQINGVKKYVIVKPNEGEVELMIKR